ncbi:NUDIX hydrolase [Curvivirga sp.]|uniref:NUDIX hydrolase n=1 Tax=Curvivirga sp. TaxID=2856848 RepID=UPI003B5B31CA
MNDIKPQIKIAAAVILNDANQILLVRKAGTDVFMQPGGKIEPNEDALSALRREVEEELGISNIEATYIGPYSAPAANEPDHEVVAEIFKAHINCQPHAAAEIAETIWFDPTSAEDIKIAPLSEILIGQFKS